MHSHETTILLWFSYGLGHYQRVTSELSQIQVLNHSQQCAAKITAHISYLPHQERYGFGMQEWYLTKDDMGLG